MIICAAIKTAGNVIVRGQRHCDCYVTAHRMRLDGKGCEEGFINSLGRFLNRRQAMSEAVTDGQMTKDNLGIDLFSEDIY